MESAIATKTTQYSNAVYRLSYFHKRGESTTMHKTYDAAFNQLYEYVCKGWSVKVSENYGALEALPKQKAIDLFFAEDKDSFKHEYYELQEMTIDG